MPFEQAQQYITRVPDPSGTTEMQAQAS